jgi:hypothetical protein
MSASEPPAGASTVNPLTPEEERLQHKLKLVVIGLGLLLVLGLLTVIGRVVYLASKKPSATSAGAPATALAAESRLDLPAGARVVSMSLDGDRLAVHFDGPSGAGIAVVELDSGRTVRLRITPEPPRN